MSNLQLVIGFFCALGATVVGLVVAVVQARRHQRRDHVVAVGVSAALLLVTLGFAESLAVRFDFQPTAFKVHMTCAYTTAAVLVGLLVSGGLHWKGKISRGAHRGLAIFWAVTVVAALGTGTWMLSGATPKAPASGATSE